MHALRAIHGAQAKMHAHRAIYATVRLPFIFRINPLVKPHTTLKRPTRVRVELYITG